MDPILSELKERLPCRSSQLEQLYNLFAYKDEEFVDNVYVYGGPSVGKSAVVTSILEELEINYALINLIECYTTKILFETILNKLSGHRIDPSRGQPYAKCDNMMDFVHCMKKCSDQGNLNGSILILDKAEELRNMDFNLLPAFLRLRELSGVSISVIFLSEIVFEKYYAKTNVIEPLRIYFPQYNKDELLNILLLDIGNAHQMIINNFNESLAFDTDFYRNYLNVFLSVFYRACRDLSELRHMAGLNFLKYCEPIINKEHTTSDSMALWRHIAPVLKASLEVLYLRVSTEQTIKANTSEQQKLNNLQPKNFTTFTKEKFLAQSLELPFYAKYLLIAAYLASYNSLKDDKRLFMKYHGRKTKTMHDIKKKSKVSEQLNTQLGPKLFTFDRLLAIFYSILDDKVGFNNNLLAQISSLVELQLLTTATDNCSLDGQKYKCNVNFDFIQTVSKMVAFNIRKYLSDFSHM